MKKLLKAWIPIIVLASLIFTFSSFPSGTANQIVLWDYLIKKTAHLTLYGMLGLLFYRMFRMYKFDLQDSGFYAVICAMFYGISDEFHQSFIAGRTSRPYDVLFDTIGAATAILVLWSILQILPKKLEKWPKKLGVS
jgi:VanZ family protein